MELLVVVCACFWKREWSWRKAGNTRDLMSFSSEVADE